MLGKMQKSLTIFSDSHFSRVSKEVSDNNDNTVTFKTQKKNGFVHF